MEPIIIAALISLIAAEFGAIVGLLRNKKDNPGFEIAAREALTRIEAALGSLKDTLERIEHKLEG